jgi:hypothetical protein
MTTLTGVGRLAGWWRILSQVADFLTRERLRLPRDPDANDMRQAYAEYMDVQNDLAEILRITPVLSGPQRVFAEERNTAGFAIPDGAVSCCATSPSITSCPTSPLGRWSTTCASEGAGSRPLLPSPNSTPSSSSSRVLMGFATVCYDLHTRLIHGPRRLRVIRRRRQRRRTSGPRFLDPWRLSQAGRGLG